MSTTYITTSIPNRIEELKWSDWHTKATLIISAGYVLSGYESTIIYTLLNIIGKSQGLDSISISCIKAMWMLGLLAGGFASEYASSIYERRNIYLYSSLALAFFSIGSGLSMSFASLLFYQFFIGIFIGGEWVIMVSYIAETIPQRHRTSVNTFLLVSWLFGVLLANLVELPLLMFLEDSLSWKIALGSASIFGIPIFIARRSLCESPEWLLRQGRVVEAESSMADIEKLSEQPYKENASLRASSFEVPILRDYFEQFHDLFVANRRTVLLEMIFSATISFAGVGINSYISTVLIPALNFSHKETSLPSTEEFRCQYPMVYPY
ncbi:hypothetical protein K7432_012139 [Basidiobolus ranarum]|uniref:Major facilitator superfamily (MFS) profile domain-containing protein n=1 Tax=Basidiobolus ranarum TaxID=34480 RepID=A0ABR2WLD3_9FUNG